MRSTAIFEESSLLGPSRKKFSCSCVASCLPRPLATSAAATASWACLLGRRSLTSTSMPVAAEGLVEPIFSFPPSMPMAALTETLRRRGAGVGRRRRRQRGVEVGREARAVAAAETILRLLRESDARSMQAPVLASSQEADALRCGEASGCCWSCRGGGGLCFSRGG